MQISRRLFVVPLADGDSGKTSIVKSIVVQGEGRSLSVNKKCARVLTSPGGRKINAYVFGRSFQETERARHKTVEKALSHSDALWRSRELVIMPSHILNAAPECFQMIEAAHEAGFDAIVASVLLNELTPSEAAYRSPIWRLNWDERWTIPNSEAYDWKGQTDALGRDLWALICRTMIPI